MASEGNRGDRADDGEPFLVGEDTRLLAARIAQQLQNTGLACEIFNLVPTDKAVLSRDRILVLSALTLLTVLAWSYLLWLSTDMGMGGMDMTGLRMIPSGFGLMVPANIPWRAMEFAFVFVMWIVMMVSMMAPSAAPMFLMYARVGRLTEARGTPFIPTVWFAAGYLLVWIAFALHATLVQWALERSELLDFTMASTDDRFAGLLFVAAGLYQWTSLNELCLTQW
jgi:predicted metal-binding membrane protein